MQAVPAQAYTYFHDDGGLYTYNFPVAFPVAYNQGNLDVPDLTSSYAASSPESIASPRTPDVVSTSLPLQQTSKKSKSRRAKDPNHIGRPANSFMIFRSELNAHVQKAGNADKINQQEISRRAATSWKTLSSEKKQRYVDAAAEQSRKQREYRESLPDGPHSKPSKKRDSTSIKRARAQKPYERPPNKTTKRVNVSLETVPSSSTVVPGPSPEQWLVEPQPSQFINPMLAQCIPTNVVEQTDYAPVTPFDLRLQSTYWQPMPPMPPSIDTTTQLPVLPPTDQQNQSFALSASEPFNYGNWSNETTSILDDQTLFAQFLTDYEAAQQS
ncbi:hypothetical protein JOM56_003171 [Amanita muscaria]